MAFGLTGPEQRVTKLAALLDATVCSIVSIDGEGTITSVNKATESLFGYPCAELLGQDVALLMTQPDSLTHDGHVKRYLGGGPARIIGIGRRVVAKHKKGHAFPIHLSVGEWSDDEGHHFIGVMHDLTEQRLMEEDLRRAQRLEALGQVAGRIAHDFNSLLVPILALTQMVLRDLPEGSTAREDLEVVAKAAKRGSALVSEILTFSKHHALNRRPVDLTAVISDAVNLLRASAPDNIDITTRIDFPKQQVLADPNQIHRAILNLVSNSQLAIGTAAGCIEVAFEQVTLAKPHLVGGVRLQAGSYAKLSVRDDGSGIEPRRMPHIFEPLFTSRPRGDGTGMGLAIVHGIVAAHGGAITVESAPGQGALFVLLLPCQI